MPRRDENIPARRDGMKIPCKREFKIVCVSIDSRGIPDKRDIPPRRDIPAKRDHVTRPFNIPSDGRRNEFIDQASEKSPFWILISTRNPLFVGWLGLDYLNDRIIIAKPKKSLESQGQGFKIIPF